MSSSPELMDLSSLAVLDEPSFEDNFDLRALFERWWADLEVSAQSRASGPSLKAMRQLESLLDLTPEFIFEGVLNFDGYSNNKIRSPGGKLVLTKAGKVDADIEVSVAVIDGIVNGNITAMESVLLESNAKVAGQITTASLSISQGAVFDGECVLTPAAPAEESFQEEKEQEKLSHFAVGV